MTFLSTWAFAFLALAPVIVLLYLLKVRRRAVTVSTLLFWQELIEQSKRRALFQRLRNLLSLLLHLLIFLLILFALARPELKRFVLSGASTVLVIDGAAQMQAMENGRRAFDLARDLASSHARHASSLNETAVVFSHAVPEMAAPFSSDETVLRRAIAELEPTDAEGDPGAALDLARSLLEARKGDTRIVVFTSRPLPDAGAGVEVVRTGSPADNTAITRFAARPLPSSPRTMEVLLEISNFGRANAAGNAEIRLDGKLLDVRPYTIDPGGRSRTTFTLAPEAARAGRGWLTATLDQPDALAVDDTARAALPELRPVRVLLVTAGDWFLENLLKADDLVAYELLSPESFKPAMAGAFDVVIFDEQAPNELDLLEGNFLFLGASPFPAPDRVLDQPLITDIDATSPLLRLVNLRNVVFLRARPVPPPADAGSWRFGTPILSFEDPLVLTALRREADGERRLAVFGFHTGDSDLPLRVAFPLLMSNTIRWLAGAVEAMPRNARAGEVVTLAPGERLAAVPSTDPDERAAAEVTGTFRPLRNGFYRIENGARTSWLAVDTFSEKESDLRAGTAATSAAPETERIAVLPRLAFWPVWFYLALAALILFSLEWFLYHRRKTE